MAKKTKVSEPDDVLMSGLDRAAKVLLDTAFPATNSSGEPAPLVDGAASSEPLVLSDQIKAFAAVSNWVGQRTTLRPPEKDKGKGELLRAQFHGAARKRRADPGEAEGETGGGAGSGPDAGSGTDDLAGTA